MKYVTTDTVTWWGVMEYVTTTDTFVSTVQ